MRFHHSTRRGRTRHSVSTHSGLASNSHGGGGLSSSAAAARWSLNYCRETNIHFNRRLPVEPPARLAARRLASKQNSGELRDENVWLTSAPPPTILSPSPRNGSMSNPEDEHNGGSEQHDQQPQQQEQPLILVADGRLISDSMLQLSVRDDNCDGSGEKTKSNKRHTLPIQSHAPGDARHEPETDPDWAGETGCMKQTTSSMILTHNVNEQKLNHFPSQPNNDYHRQQEAQVEQNNKFMKRRNMKLDDSQRKQARHHSNPGQANHQAAQDAFASESFDMKAVRERLLCQVRKHLFWSNKAAKRMHLDILEKRRIYIYELVSFCERRQLEWRYEPYRGGPVQSGPFNVQQTSWSGAPITSPSPTPAPAPSTLASSSSTLQTHNHNHNNHQKQPQLQHRHEQHQLQQSPEVGIANSRLSTNPLSIFARDAKISGNTFHDITPASTVGLVPRSLPGSPSASIDHGHRANLLNDYRDHEQHLIEQSQNQQLDNHRRLRLIETPRDRKKQLEPSPGLGSDLRQTRNMMARSNSTTTSPYRQQHPNYTTRSKNINFDHQGTSAKIVNNQDDPIDQQCSASPFSYNINTAGSMNTMIYNDDRLTGSTQHQLAAVNSSASLPIGSSQRSLPSSEVVWSIPLEPKSLNPSPFKGYAHSSELPNSSFVKRCHGCQGKGRLKCKSCYGVGYEVCISCSGKGTTRSLHSSGRYSNNSGLGGGIDGSRGGGSNSGGGGITGGGAGITWSGDSTGGIDTISDSRASRNDSYWSGNQTNSSSSAWVTESCHFCHGAGQKRCWVCAGKSYNHCPGCFGAGRLRCYLMLHIIFLNHRDEFFLNNSDEIIPKDRLRLASGRLILNESADQLSPLTSNKLIAAFEESTPSSSQDNKDSPSNGIDSNNENRSELDNENVHRLVAASGSLNKLDDICLLQSTCRKLMDKHHEMYRNERLIKQRHSITQIEADVVSYEWKRRSGKFCIYGDERKVYIAKYPFKSICSIT